MKKKLFGMFLTATLIAGLLAGCGSSAATVTTAAKAAATTAADKAAAAATTAAATTKAATATTKAESTSVAAAADGKGKTIGAIYWSLNNNFMVFLKDNIDAESKVLGYKTIAMDSKSSTETELNNVEDLISKKVDAVILVPMDSEGSSNAVKLLNEAKIPVITVDRSTKEGEVITSIATDNYAGGQKAGKFAVEKLGGKGKVAILRGTLGTNLETERYSGFTDTIKGTGIEIAAEQSANFDRTTAFNTIENILQATPDINLVYAENDEMCLGVAKALEAGNRKDVMVIGFDGATETLQAIKDGKVTGTVFQQFALIGKTSVDVADKVFKGDTAGIKNPMPIDCDFASADNVDKFLK